MKIIKLAQNTPEWLEWRKDKIGASDVPIILGKSPFKSAYDLYLEKTDKVIQKENANQAYGKAKEQEVLAMYMERTGQQVSPACVESEGDPWLVASLDGATFDFTRIVEVKCPNAEVFAMAKKGVLPQHYMLQVQAQLHCVLDPNTTSVTTSVSASVSASVCDYVVFHKGEIAIVEVQPDPKFKENLPALKEFWERTAQGIEPETTPEDCIYIENDPEFEKAANAYWELKEKSDQVKEEFEAARAYLLAFGDGLSCRGYNTKIQVGFKKGTVDYAKIPQLKDVDLEIYRKVPVKESRIYQIPNLKFQIPNSKFQI